MNVRSVFLDAAPQEKGAYDGQATLMRQPMLLTISQVSQQLGLSPAKIHRLVALEGLPIVKFGRAIRVPYDSLYQWVKAREASQRFSCIQGV